MDQRIQIIMEWCFSRQNLRFNQKYFISPIQFWSCCSLMLCWSFRNERQLSINNRPNYTQSRHNQQCRISFCWNLFKLAKHLLLFHWFTIRITCSLRSPLKYFRCWKSPWRYCLLDLWWTSTQAHLIMNNWAELVW